MQENSNVLSKGEKQRTSKNPLGMLILHSALLLSEFALNSDRALTSAIQKGFCLLLYLAFVRQATMRHWCRPCCSGNDVKWQSVEAESLNYLLLKSGGTSRSNSTAQKRVKTDLLPSTELKQKLQKHFWLLAVVTHL